MACRCNSNIWPYHSAISNINMPVINSSQVKISINIIAQMKMSSAPICIKRRLEIAIFSTFGKHKTEKFLNPLFIAQAERVIFFQILRHTCLLVHYFISCRVINQPLFHSLLLSHNNHQILSIFLNIISKNPVYGKQTTVLS